MTSKDLLSIDIQLFAEEEQEQDTGKEGATDGTGATSEQEEQDGSKETLTMDEVQKMIQSETDKRVTKMQKDLETIKKEKEELEKEKMTAEEKRKYEEEKRKQELEEKDRQLTAKELRIKSFEVMKEQDIPSDMQDVLLAGVDSEETMKERAEKVSKTFKQAVNTAVEEKLKEYGREPETHPAGEKDTSAMSMEEYEAWWNKHHKRN